MAEYRVYTVGADGRFIGFEPLVCGDDRQAIERAKHLFEHNDIEVWSGPRLVASLKHKSRWRGIVRSRPNADSRFCRPWFAPDFLGTSATPSGHAGSLKDHDGPSFSRDPNAAGAEIASTRAD